MLPKSIRWRLPLSYGAIALIATLILGVVLLTTLRGYYARQERHYLMANAQGIARRMARLLTLGASRKDLQSQVEVFAFLSQTRVRVRDATGQILADSGMPESVQVVYGVAHSGDNDAISAIWRPSTATTSGTQDTEVFTTTEVPGLASISPRPAIAVFHRFDLEPKAAMSPRSDQFVQTVFYDQAGNLLGTVELSDGLAYGHEIVSSVARAWAVASGVAVALATGVGWLISRQMSDPLRALTSVTAQMAEGDLATRADVTRQDEFGALARSFNQMARRIEEMVTTLRRFVSDAAHELHTPLTALRTNLELAAEAEPEEGRHFVAQAWKQVARLEALTEGLLDLSRLEACDASILHEPLDLTALVRKVSVIYASRAQQTGITFVLDLPETPLTVFGNSDQLSRAIGNLLDNALKFTPAGGSVTLGLQQDGEQVQLWVQDSGIGIPEEDLPHLFERFHRGRNATTYPGSGLGLAIAKAIVKAHGGRVWATSEEGKGSCFGFKLPASP
jgi:signal transduction histidine kinase